MCGLVETRILCSMVSTCVVVVGDSVVSVNNSAVVAVVVASPMPKRCA
jgi:hypothetical protein